MNVKFNGSFRIGEGFPYEQIGAESLITADRQAPPELLLEFKDRLEREALKMAKEIEMAGYEISTLSVNIIANTDPQNESELF